MDLLRWAKGKTGETRFEEQEPPVSHTMVWICEKCGAKLDRSDGTEKNPAHALQKAMKHILSENKEKRNIRAMVSTCMNICPSEKIAVTWIELKSGKTHFKAFGLGADIDQTARDLYKEIT